MTSARCPCDSPAHAIDRDPSATHAEVRSTHVSMGIDPDVWRVVGDALADGP